MTVFFRSLHAFQPTNRRIRSWCHLDEIEASLLAFAGKTDNLVPPDVAAKSVDVVASDDAEFRVAPGGHMGVIIGSKAQSAVWKESAEWLASRSDAKEGNSAQTPAARKAATASKAKARPKAKAKTRAKAKAKARPKAKAKSKSKAKPKVRRKTATR